MSAAVTAPVAIRVHDLHKSFGPLEVLKGVSLDAREGEVISILGSSGSGKSTLLRCINMLEVPNSGTIEVAGEAIRLKTLSDGRSRPADQKQVDRIRSNSAWCSRASISGPTRPCSKTSSRRRCMC
ncbi:phosphonate ABC transporter, ATP-binding protein [compost metagenome]